MLAPSELGERRPGLVGRFALASLVVFVATGAVLSMIVSRQFVGRQEQAAQFHAQFVVHSILRYRLGSVDLSAPIQGSEYRKLRRFVEQRVLDRAIVRVKIWNPDGTIVFSDEPRLVGARFSGEPDEEAIEGTTVSEITDLQEEENVYERGLADKLFSSYVPLWLDGSRRGTPDAIVEMYQDYASIHSQVSSLFRTTVLAFAIGLSLSYLFSLPIAWGASRRLQRQKGQLVDQAGRLETLLAREQQTVGELRQLAKMQSDFVAVASHELRTPLTAIVGYTKTLRQPAFGDDEETRAEFLAAVERQADRLHRMVSNLLMASKVEEGDVHLDVSTFDFADLVAEVLEGFHGAAKRVVLDIPDHLPPVESDRERVITILTNLVDNALKYSPEDSSVELGARVNSEGLRFWVEDRGVGITLEDRRHIFDRFYQADQSSTRRFGGVGLGLHLVHGLVAQLDGRITVASEPGKGSAFLVTIPLRREDDQELDEPVIVPSEGLGVP
jgi:signal transduction histidine kinase